MDKDTKVGEVIAATSVKSGVYTIGKMLSNVAVLLAMVSLVFLSAIVLQIIRGEDLNINLVALAIPFLFITVPVVFLIAATSVLFETISVLRSSLGNIIYLSLCLFVLLYTIRGRNVFFDPLGVIIVLSSIQSAVSTHDPTANPTVWGFGLATANMTTKTFIWSGIAWIFPILFTRMFLVLIALFLSFIASFFFSRFDPSQERFSKSLKPKFSIDMPDLFTFGDKSIPNHLTDSESMHQLTNFQLTSLTEDDYRFQFLGVLFAEMKIMTRDVSKWWFVVAAGLVLTTLIAPLQVNLMILWPIAWIWILPICSKLGTREVRNNTEQLIFSIPNSLSYHLPAVWLSGFFLAIIMGSGVAIKFILEQYWIHLLSFVVGAAFISSLALFLGIYTRNNMVFEGLYCFLWYIGPFEKIDIFDFMGTSQSVLDLGIWSIFLILSVIFFILGYFGRKRQIQIY
ncbi:MAG: hypothetical protein ACFFBD_24795 [Candidatus Hodarchaeota archaeon]